jgi:hypothetical protein
LRCSSSRPNCLTAAASAARASGAFTMPSGMARARRSETRQERSVSLGASSMWACAEYRCAAGGVESDAPGRGSNTGRGLRPTDRSSAG